MQNVRFTLFCLFEKCFNIVIGERENWWARVELDDKKKTEEERKIMINAPIPIVKRCPAFGVASLICLFI